MVTKKAMLEKLIDKYPNLKYNEAKEEITTLTEPYFNKVKSIYKNSKGKRKGKKKGKKVKTQAKGNSSITAFIDDPNELLLSTAIRELNKPNPDPRWANILISCKKEKITTESEVIDQFKQQTTQTLVNILKGFSQTEHS